MPTHGTPGAAPRYALRLYVTGNTPRSLRAVINVRILCDELLADRCDLEVIDVYQEPTRAREARVVAAPTLIKELPWPPTRIVGDLSRRERLLAALGLRADDPSSPPAPEHDPR